MAISTPFVFIWNTFLSIISFPFYAFRWIFGLGHIDNRQQKLKDVERGVKGHALLTAQEISALTRSWQCMINDRKRNGIELFMKLFTMYPVAQDFFPFRGVPLSELRQNKKFLNHATTVMYGFQTFIDQIEDVECLIDLVKKTADSHIQRGITFEEFKLLLPAVLGQVEEAMGPEFDDEIRAAWVKLFDLVIDGVKKRQNKAANGGVPEVKVEPK